MKKWIAVALLVIVIIGAAYYAVRVWNRRPPAQQEVSLKIPDPRFMGILPFYVADEKGFFRQEGIAVQWIDVKDPGMAEKLFTSDQADLNITTFASMLAAEVRQPGSIKLLFPIYEAADKPGSFILVRPESSIRTVKDLRGKTLGTYSGPSQKAYALIVLQKLGLREPDDVKLVQVASSAQVQSLFGGAFDALFTVEPYGATAITNGARVVEEGVRVKYISNPFWVGSAAVHSSFAQQHPDRVQAIIRALEKATSYIREHESEAREILARRTGIDKSVAARSAFYTWVPHPSEADLRQIQEHFDLLVEQKLLDRKAVAGELFVNASAK